MKLLPVEPNPTLIFSTKILSPTENGKLLAVLNPTSNVRVTVWVELLYSTVLIPTPPLLCIGIIVGRVSLNPYTFFLISTSDLPRVYFKSTSGTCF